MRTALTREMLVRFEVAAEISKEKYFSFWHIKQNKQKTKIKIKVKQRN